MNIQADNDDENQPCFNYRAATGACSGRGSANEGSSTESPTASWSPANTKRNTCKKYFYTFALHAKA